MNIGLLAFQNAINYGAVLQMYALKTKLENMGHNVEVINYFCESIEMGNKIDREPYVSKSANLRLLKKIYLKIEFLRTQKTWKKKYSMFKTFREEYLNLSKKYFKETDLNNISKYDAIIVGSDQIWNPNITNGFDPVYFCAFETTKNIKKIAYSASCGSVNTIKNNSEKFYELIKNFDFISAREEELNEIINRRSKSVRTLDPSLLLDVKDYNNIAELPNENDYLLIYKMQDNKELYLISKKIAKDKGLKIIELGLPPVKRDNQIDYVSDASPQEFLGYFEKASFVITNSFHGTAFSIKYNREFLTVPHRSVGQRMINLLTLLKLNDRIITESTQLDDSKLSEVNYEKVNLLLDKEIEN